MIDHTYASGSIPGCDIDLGERYLRGVVAAGVAAEVQACYRALANECLQRNCTRVLVIGRATLDAFSHLAGRDALRSMALAGVASGFRLALVAETADLIAVYDAAVLEALRLGLDARRFLSEADAARWLES